MNTSRLSLNQMFTLMVLFLTASATLNNVGRLSGKDIWIVILVAGILGTVLFTFFHRISYLHGYSSVTMIFKDVFGKFLGSLIVLIYAIYFIYMASRIAIGTSNMVQYTIMQDSNRLLVIGLLLLVVVYGLRAGFNTVGRTAEILFYLVIISFIPLIVSVFTSSIFQPTNLLPILEDGFKKIIPDIYTTSVYPYGELVVMLALFPLIPQKSAPKILKVSYAAIGVATVFLLIVDVFNVGILGSDLTYNFVFPFYNSMKMVGVNIFFERLDPLAIIILLATCFLKICIYFYAAVSLLEGIVKKFTYRQITIPIAIGMLIFCKFFQVNQTENLYQVLKIQPKYVLPIFELAIPGLVWIISEIKYRKNPKQKSEAT